MTYTPTYSFAGYQATSPSDPLPATQLDRQLQDIAAEFGGLSAKIDAVVRSDNNLANGVVTLDALAPDVVEAINAGGTGGGGSFEIPFATVEQAEAGAASALVIAPLTTKAAIDKFRPYASQADAAAGVGNVQIMTPLRTKEAVGAVRPYATTLEATTAQAVDRVMSPKTSRDALEAYIKKHSATVSAAFGTVPTTAPVGVIVTVPGARAGDAVLVAPTQPGFAPDVVLWGFVTGDDTVRVSAAAMGSAAVALASVELRVTALKI